MTAYKKIVIAVIARSTAPKIEVTMLRNKRNWSRKYDYQPTYW